MFMKKDIFHLVTIKDGVSDSAAIINVFAEMAEKRLKCDIQLLNYYDEVPITYCASITSLEKDSLELSIHEHQAVVMKHDNSTLIKSKHFHNGLGVHCYASYTNVPKKVTILHNFAYAQIRAERREAVRVKVHKVMPIAFCSEMDDVVGNVLDISTSGIAIKHTIPVKLTADSPIPISLTLKNTPLEIPGTLIKSIKDGDNNYISIFQVKPGRMADNIIGQFVYERQVEIIQQLKDGLV
jgi:hypothetical protein